MTKLVNTFVNESDSLVEVWTAKQLFKVRMRLEQAHACEGEPVESSTAVRLVSRRMPSLVVHRSPYLKKDPQWPHYQTLHLTEAVS